MKEIKKEKQIDVKRFGGQEVGSVMILLLQCMNLGDEEELTRDVLVIIGNCKNENIYWTYWKKEHNAKEWKTEKRCILCWVASMGHYMVDAPKNPKEVSNWSKSTPKRRKE